ncbi:Protein FMP52, mitochondrial [Ceratocystis lukuohia]|uniref:Protein fmp-52 mitochondrial n=2 Tax=Ceratocystis TaxID=5157 RepID=A0A0F8AZ23_CERFI|nr:Protein fmp-52 mitochondrial [Ceratocystis platani]
MAATLIIGSTGLVGNEALKALIASDAFPALQTIGRRVPKQTSPKLTPVVNSDTAKWADALKALSPTPITVISGLGTTRAQAGGIANQWKIDHDLNIELAKAAKAAGVKNYVFISSASSRSLVARSFPYAKMKIGVEDCIMGLGFESAVIVRPGLIMGTREQPHTGQGVFTAIVKGLGSLSQGVADSIGQDSDVIGRAAVAAAKQAAEGKAPANPWILEPADIVRLGRTEWKE